MLHYDGKYKDAISTYQEAIYYEEQGQGCAPIPFLATLYGGLGAVYAICGDVFNAVLSYSRAQALQPSVLSYTKQLFLLFKDAGLRRPTMEVRDHFMLVGRADLCLEYARITLSCIKRSVQCTKSYSRLWVCFMEFDIKNFLLPIGFRFQVPRMQTSKKCCS